MFLENQGIIDQILKHSKGIWCLKASLQHLRTSEHKIYNNLSRSCLICGIFSVFKARNPNPWTLNPCPWTLNLGPWTLNPKPKTLNTFLYWSDIDKNVGVDVSIELNSFTTLIISIVCVKCYLVWGIHNLKRTNNFMS